MDLWNQSNERGCWTPSFSRHLNDWEIEIVGHFFSRLQEKAVIRRETLLGWHDSFVGRKRKKAWGATPLACVITYAPHMIYSTLISGLVTEEYQAVNVSVKVDILRSEIMADGVDPRLQTFFWCSKPHKRRRLKNQVQNANHVFLHFLESGSPNFFSEAHKGFLEKDDGTDSFLIAHHNNFSRILNDCPS
ncbi:hypothetical protein CK203_076819 [Vitis vinifera]|uniref:Uncharacterized protein n=1 Tax=Vitis vinifera TaxID=29760 RepID=A0A438ESV3_VITVI|nr:hypothetical protein CK203_076819 [Vitis vinifera]